MTWLLLRIKQIAAYRFQPKHQSLFSGIVQAVHNRTQPVRSFHRASLITKLGDQSPNDYNIDIVDDETWQVSTGFANIAKDTTSSSPAQVIKPAPRNADDTGFDDIDDLRICGKLFYKLDRDSKEYEEYNYDFHRRKKVSKNKIKETPNENVSKRKDEIRENKMKVNPTNNVKMDESFSGKKQRVPTFNQLTGPYHEPFCLDIYISKASVRACIVHRATSNVVAVAHSISKDMKFDLDSTKNAVACAAVGKVLAQRALADDIHNVIYTPRKGEKLEGKLQCVLQSVINNGVLVKVKLKQKNARKPVFQYADHNRN